MSVHTLKPAQDVKWPAEWVAGLPEALEQLQHWAQFRPLHCALRHKLHGRGYAWRWIDALPSGYCAAVLSNAWPMVCASTGLANTRGCW